MLDSLSLEVEPRQSVALVGPSGCGKSTLLELIAGLAEPAAGRIAVGDASAAPERLDRCAWMAQSDLLLPWSRTIDNAALGARLGGRSRGEARELARPVLERLGLSGFEQARPAELSGGMRQRVAFARTLLAGRGVLLLDEPFASLDAITRADLQAWLRRALAAEARTVVLVTHDVEEAILLADRVIVLSPRPGGIVADLAAPERSGEAVSVDRATLVADPAFVAVRERALRALAGDVA